MNTPRECVPFDDGVGLSKLRQSSVSVSYALARSPLNARQLLAPMPGTTDNDPHIYVEDAFPARTLIPSRTVENIIQASAHSWHIGKRLLHHLTIRWPSGDWSQHQSTQDTLAKWLSRKCGGAYYVWAKEGNSAPHSHFLLHLSNGMTSSDCRTIIIRHLKREANMRVLPRGTVRCQKPNYAQPLFESMKNRVSYICKGGGPEVCRFLKVNKSDWACVPDKQAGVSEILGETARRHFGGCLPSGCRSVPTDRRSTDINKSVAL